MSLKENVQKRLQGMKVEGDWRMKLAVYGGAILIVALILGVTYGLFGHIGSGPPEVGTVTLKSAGVEVTPLENQIYITQKGEREDSRRLVPAEVGTALPRWYLITPPPFSLKEVPIMALLRLPFMTKREESIQRPPKPLPALRSLENISSVRKPTGDKPKRTSAWNIISGSK